MSATATQTVGKIEEIQGVVIEAVFEELGNPGEEVVSPSHYGPPPP